MRRLAGRLEHLDGPLDDRSALRDNLRDMRRANRWLGGARLSRAAVLKLIRHQRAPVTGRRGLRVLDVGTGSADVPLALVAWGERHGRALEVTAVDDRPEIVDIAREVVGAHHAITLRVADGRALPYADASFDVAHASLVAHHLEPGELQSLLGEMARVSRLGVVVNDLDRTPLTWVGAYALSRFATRNPLTRHDAPLSVRRAYRPTELAAIARRAGLHPVARVYGPFLHRYALAFAPLPPVARPSADRPGANVVE